MHDLITIGILAPIYNGVIKHGYIHFVEDLKLFLRIRYKKFIERLNRYEELLYRVLNFVFEKLSKGEIKIVDSKPIERNRV